MARSDMETIEIGAVAVGLDKFESLSTFQIYIKPVVHRALTEFCIELTGIEQETVDAADFFYDAIRSFSAWIDLQTNVKAWSSWGAYDRGQFALDCKRHQQTNLLDGIQHLNLKTAYAAAMNTRSKGMANALKEQNIDLIGRHHSGLDDAINISRLLRLSPAFQQYVSRSIKSHD